jgi:2-amino-4-hydroxy-6-hydroxymethyldihydropteridine diphosphokinase
MQKSLGKDVAKTNFMQPHIVFLQLGSNMGQRSELLARARSLIAQRIGPILLSSSVMETAAWGNTDQPSFLNQVLKIISFLGPEDLLDAALTIEKDLGRERSEKWGPRLIDIDIIAIEQQIIDLPHLSVPHLWLHQRLFVLQPMAEIAPDWQHPVYKRSVRDMMESLL